MVAFFTEVSISHALAFEPSAAVPQPIAPPALESRKQAPSMYDSAGKAGEVWEFVVSSGVGESSKPSFARTFFNYAQSALTGLASIGALMVTWPVDFEKYNPKEGECNPHQTPLLLIHGFTGSSNNWMYHAYEFGWAGYTNVFTINLGSAFQDMDSCADKVHEMVEEIKKRTGRTDLKIVGHSMGGLVAIHYHQRYPEDVEVKDIITLGAPLDGTRVAVIAQGSPLAEQMRYQSAFVKEKQAKMAEDHHTRYLHLVSDCDWFIWPSYSAGVQAAPRTKVVHLEETGHVPFLFSRQTSEAMIAHLDDY